MLSSLHCPPAGLDHRHDTEHNTYLPSYLLPYLLTLWIRVLLEKLTGFQLVEKFPTFYGTRKFITAFTSTRPLSLSWASSIQPIPPHSTSWKCNLILSSHLAWVFQLAPSPQVSPQIPYLHLTKISFFWGVTHRISVVTDVSGKTYLPIFNW